MLERRVIIGGEEKCEPMLGQRLGGCFTGKADGHSKRLEHIGAAALRSGGAVSVLGNKDARGRADKRGSGRDVESSQAISACAYDIQDLARAYWGIKVGQNRFSKQRPSKGSNLLDRFAFWRKLAEKFRLNSRGDRIICELLDRVSNFSIDERLPDGKLLNEFFQHTTSLKQGV